MTPLDKTSIDENFFDSPATMRLCDCPGCGKPGEYRAPKNKNLPDSYYFFCLDHVREYNAAWNYFAELSPDEIEEKIRFATVWERPSWPFGEWQNEKTAEKPFDSVFDNDAPPMPRRAAPGEVEALAVLGLEHPSDLAAIKARYHQLAKLHHPDANGGSPRAEEKIKIINQAYVFLCALRGNEETKV
jgi:hypothetical protein